MADLTTLSAVKQYLTLKSDGSDALIQRLIPAESRLIERYTGRKFPFVTTVGKRLDGTGTGMLMLPDHPVVAIQSLTVCGNDVPAAANDQSTGYLFDDTTLYLASGQRFPKGRQNVVCSWTSGYEANVPVMIPEGNVPTVTIVDPGSPSTIVSITSSTGVVFTATANAPAAHQYQFLPPNIIFAPADSDTVVTVDMRYVPALIEQACIEMVGLDIKQRDNLGIKSKTLANESITYDNSGLTPSVQQMLQPYRSMVPL